MNYKDLVMKARKKSLKLTLKQQQEIVDIYTDVIDDLAEKAERYGEDTLTYRWLEDYTLQVFKARSRLIDDLNGSIRNSIKQAGKNAIEPDLELFNQAQRKAGIDLGDHFTEMFSQVPDDVLAIIVKGDLYRDGKGLSERIWNHTNEFGQDIDYIIKRAMAEKKSALELAKDLEHFVKPEYQRPWSWGNVYPILRTKQVDYNAQRLARTSITHAHRESQYRSAAQNPFVEAIHWELSDAHFERQVVRWGEDECDEYANQNWYNLGKGNFPIEEVPLSHPQCLCFTYPVIPKSLDQIADELKAWEQGENPELDDFFEGKVVEKTITKREKNYAEIGKKFALERQQNDRIHKMSVDSYIRMNEIQLDELKLSLKYDGLDKKGYERVKREIEKANEIFKGDYIFELEDRPRKRSIKYKRDEEEGKKSFYFYKPVVYDEQLDGMYYLNYHGRVNKKQKEEIKRVIDEVFQENKRAAGVKIQISNSEVKNRRACYYRPRDDKIVIGTKDILDRYWGGAGSTVAHEIAHRPHSMLESHEDLAISKEDKKQWEKLTEKYYQKYRIEKEKLDWKRFDYPINAEDHYRDRQKYHFYNEMWAEVSSVMTAPDDENYDRKEEIEKLEKYFPGLKEFVDKVYGLEG